MVVKAEAEAPCAPTDSGYTFNKDAPKNVNDIMSRDKEDESLKRYKEQLLGSAATKEEDSSDPRKVILTDFIVILKDGKELSFNLENSVEGIKFELNEGCEYKIKFGFKVKHEIVSGLQVDFKAWKKLLKLAGNKEHVVMGSYGPKVEKQWFEFPRHEYLDAPKGMVGRGEYKGILELTDVDKAKHSEVKFAFKITK